MTTVPTPSDIIQVAPFTAFVPRFEELIAGSSRMAVYFIHSRRWRENHDSAIRAMLARPGTTLEVFLPDLENHELMYSLEKHFDDGPLIPALVVDAYRFFSRLSREYGRPSEVWLFGRWSVAHAKVLICVPMLPSLASAGACAAGCSSCCTAAASLCMAFLNSRVCFSCSTWTCCICRALLTAALTEISMGNASR